MEGEKWERRERSSPANFFSCQDWGFKDEHREVDSIQIQI
jgi:hypothetical protein